jgi:hypothetical protein
MLICTPPGPAGIGRCERCGDDFGKAFANDKLCRICEPRIPVYRCQQCGASYAQMPIDAPELCGKCAGIEQGTVQ